ncbi:MAG: hypothetical protein ACOX7R_08780 [Acetivibrionales bacterium]|jgi:hypothetical protein
MKKKIISLCQNIFGICLTIAVLIGAIVAVLFVIGFIAGGSVGESLAIFSKSIMYKAITLSAIGSLIGMLAFYIEGTHELKMDSSEEAEEGDARDASLDSSSTSVKM